MIRYGIVLVLLLCITKISNASVCVPEPFNAVQAQVGSCPDNIPTKIALDLRGMQIITTLANCTDNKFDLYQSYIGQIPELALGDYFEYTVWWAERDTQCIVDLYYYNGTSNTMRDKYILDQNGLPHHPLITEVGQYAYGQWYTRRIPLPWDIIGNVYISVQVACNSYLNAGSAGTKIAWFKSIRFLDSNLNLRKTIMDSAVLPPGCPTTNMCDLGCTSVCQVLSDCTCNSIPYDDCLSNITCSEAPTCSCARGYKGALCVEPVCSNGCSAGEYCSAPETCKCIETIPGQCSQECALPKPTEESICRIIDGNPTWVYNQTVLVNNGTVTVSTDVLVIGDVVLSGDTVVVISDGAVITVTGCPTVNGSLLLGLSAEEISELEKQGSLNRTVLLYDATCKDTGEFLSVGVQNKDDCALYGSSQENNPGSFVVLVTKQSLPCNYVSNPNALLMPDWSIAVLVVGSVVVAGVAIAVGIVVRKKRIEAEIGSFENRSVSDAKKMIN